MNGHVGDARFGKELPEILRDAYVHGHFLTDALSDDATSHFSGGPRICEIPDPCVDISGVLQHVIAKPMILQDFEM